MKPFPILVLLDEALPHISDGEEKALEEFDDLIYWAFCGNEDDCHEALFRELSRPSMRRLLRKIYKAPQFEAQEELSLRDVLPFFKATKTLYGPEGNMPFRCGLFLRGTFLKKPVNSYAEACTLSQEYWELVETVAYTNLGQSFFSVNEKEKDEEKKSALREKLRIEGFGSLDEIFGFFGVQEGFRKKFPTDNLFWNQRGYATFNTVLEDLERKKRPGLSIEEFLMELLLRKQR